MATRKRKTADEPVQGMVVSAETSAVASAKPVRVTLATKKEAVTLTEQIQAEFRGMAAAWWELGKKVRDALDRGVPAALEMNAHAWMKLCFDDSIAKIHYCLKVARALDGVPEEKIKLLTIGKAKELARLPQEMRTSDEWVSSAIGLSNEDFHEAVETWFESKGVPRSEERVHIGVQVPKTVAELWEAAEKKVAGLLEIDIELKPGLRAQVFEAVAALINDTPEEVLRSEMVGGEEAA